MSATAGGQGLVRHAWWGVLIAISMLCLGMTFFADEVASAYGAADRSIRLLWIRKLELGRENSFGAWWGGTLLLIASLHALDGFIDDRRGLRARAAWLCIAAVLALSSLDEVGSLHERVAVQVFPHGFQVKVVLGSVLAAVIAVSIAILAGSTATRRSAWLIGIGFALLAGAALYDLVVHRPHGSADGASARRTLQAACELAGMLVLALAASRNSAGVFDRRGRQTEPVFLALDHYGAAFVLAGALVAVPVCMATVALMTDHYQGLPAN
jgi:hypothetical protein